MKEKLEAKMGHFHSFMTIIKYRFVNILTQNVAFNIELNEFVIQE